MRRQKEIALLSQTQTKVMKLVLFTLPLVIISFILTLNYTKRISETPIDQLRAIAKGDLHEAYLLTSKSYQQKISFDGFKTFIAQYPTLQTNKGIQFNSQFHNKKLGVLKGIIKAENGKTSPIEYSLIHEKSGWRITDMKIAA